MNYYNENDPKAAAWLRELISAGHIPAGDVDERSILEVRPYEIQDYDQHHFFAGIGGWALSLRLAGWPDDRRVITGSCPCQPFSTAGRGLAEADERWAGNRARDESGRDLLQRAREEGSVEPGECREAGGMGEADHGRHGRERDGTGGRGESECGGASGQMGDTIRPGLEGHAGNGNHRDEPGRLDSIEDRPTPPPSRPWDAFDLLPCTDGKARRIEPGTFPLVARLPGDLVHSGYPGLPISPAEALATPEGRVLRLRGYGNAIVPQLAAEFVIAYLETKTS